MSYSFRAGFIVSALLVLLTGCQSADLTTEQVRETAAPSTVPARSETDFTNALVCMDLMLQSAGVGQSAPLVIATESIPDRTGKVSAGALEMLIGAMSTMSSNSKAVRFIPWDRQRILVLFQQQPTKDLQLPLFFLRGAVTQADQAVSKDQLGASVDVKDKANATASADASVDTITLDMSAEYVRSLQVVPGVTARNSIRVGQKGAAIEPGGFIGKTGMLFNFNFSKREGSHQALRALVELGAIEMVGQMTNLPYWHCLQMTTMDPEFIAEADHKFDAMSEADRVSYVSRLLKGYSIYKGAVTSIMTPALSSAIAEFERQYGQLPDGRIDSDLLRRFYMIEKTSAGWWSPKLFRARYANSIAFKEVKQHQAHLSALRARSKAQVAATPKAGRAAEPVSNSVTLSSADRFQKVATSTITSAYMVRNAQRALIEMGHRTRSEDGRLDADMVTEIRRFEKSSNLPLNGELNEQLYKRLVGSIKSDPRPEQRVPVKKRRFN